MNQPQPKPRDEVPQELFQHFETDEQLQEYLRYVEQGQKDGSIPF